MATVLLPLIGNAKFSLNVDRRKIEKSFIFYIVFYIVINEEVMLSFKKENGEILILITLKLLEDDKGDLLNYKQMYYYY